jgi:hypothetical protein
MAYILTGGVDIDNLTIKKDVLGRLYVPIDNSTIKKDASSGNLYANVLMDNDTIKKDSNGYYHAQIGVVNRDTTNLKAIAYIDAINKPTGYLVGSGATTIYAYDYTTKNLTGTGTWSSTATIIPATTGFSNMADNSIGSYANVNVKASNTGTVTCDLGASYTGFVAVKIIGNGTDQYVEYSTDNSTYTTLFSATNPNNIDLSFSSSSITARYIRGRFVNNSSSAINSSVFNIAFFDKNNPNTTLTKSGKFIEPMANIPNYDVILFDPQINWYVFTSKV